MEKLKYIYGAHMVATGVYKALNTLHSDLEIKGFVVSSMEGNPKKLFGIPVISLENLDELYPGESKQNICILICTPENLHGEIIESLAKVGFFEYECYDSKKEAELMERYYSYIHNFEPLKSSAGYIESSETKENFDTFTKTVRLFQACHEADKPLSCTWESPGYILPIQVGTAISKTKVVNAKAFDNEGDNISEKNKNYCELTALYWIWKNVSSNGDCKKELSADYYGLCHYRRILDLDDEGITSFNIKRPDVLISYPTIHYPDITEHYQRYIKEADFEAAKQALREISPDYYDKLPEILSQEYFYNYNMFLAKRSVFNDFCTWLFRVLKRTGELSNPKEIDRADRYMGYIAETLTTIYFMYNKDSLRIVHTGRKMLV